MGHKPSGISSIHELEVQEEAKCSILLECMSIFCQERREAGGKDARFAPLRISMNKSNKDSSKLHNCEPI